MGIFGEIGLGAVGEAAGQYFGGSAGRAAGRTIGSTLGSFLPFKKGGKVKHARKAMRKGGLAESGDGMRMGGRVASHTKMMDGGIVPGQFVPANHMVASAKPAMGIMVPKPEVLGYKPMYLMA